MAKYQFQFRALMSYRRNRRDLCRQLLAQALSEDEALQQRRKSIESEREIQLRELKQHSQSEQLNVGAAAARRYYAGRLLGEVKQLDQVRETVSQQIDACRRLLLQADQDVRVLERLEERGRAEFAYNEQRRDALLAEDVWFAQHSRSLS